MTPILNFGHSDWEGEFSAAEQAAAIAAIEDSGIVIFPHLAFNFSADEQSLYESVAPAGGAKNVSYTTAGEIGGVDEAQKHNPVLAGMLKRFTESAQGL